MNTVLLVDDDKLMREILRKNLEKHDFSILEAIHGKRLIEIVSRQPVDAILLDLGLPDGSGLTFLKDIRKYTQAPIIILSGEHANTIKVQGLEAGADDYIEKPFDMDVLIARLHATLRRYKETKANENQLETKNKDIDGYQFSNWSLSIKHHQIFDHQGHSADLTPCEFKLLCALIQNAGRPLKRENLSEAVREQNYRPTPRAIDVKITRLRKKIGDDSHPAQIIQTIHGMGYMCSDR